MMFPQPPDPEEVRAARVAKNHSQTEAAAVIYKARGTWAQWESGERKMDPAFFELYLIKSAKPA